MAEKTVQIPLSIFYLTIDFLEHFNAHKNEWNPVLYACHETILSAYLLKNQRLGLRKSYSEIIFAQNDDERWEARMEYLQKKRDIAQRG